MKTIIDADALVIGSLAYNLRLIPKDMAFRCSCILAAIRNAQAKTA